MEKYLYLCIQLPVTNESSIVVLEGEYRNRLPEEEVEQFDLSQINVQNIKYISDAQINQKLLSNLSLLLMNTRTSYAFSNRLMEYLLWNVIDYQDEISQNTLRIQEYQELYRYKTYAPGVFDKETRFLTYNGYMHDENTSDIDINGFVDKDVEKFVTRGFDA
jgi:hypothetical protein